jgi:hypothetical protein
MGYPIKIDIIVLFSNALLCYVAAIFKVGCQSSPHSFSESVTIHRPRHSFFVNINITVNYVLDCIRLL